MRKQELQSALSEIKAPDMLLTKVIRRAKPRRSLRPLVIIAYTILIGAIGFALGGAAMYNSPQEASTPVDYTMQAYLVNAEGEVQETLEISVNGYIHGEKDKRPKLDLSIILPESFRYRYDKPDQGMSASFSGVYDDLSYYVWAGYSLDMDTSEAIFGIYAMCVVEEYLIMDWDDDESLYLVAATDRYTAPKEILDYFEGYLDMYAFEN